MDTALLIGLVINLILSFVVANIAVEKGRSYAGFFWLSFLLSFLIGLLVVLASQPITKNQLGDVDSRLLVKCPMCAEQILAEAKVCKHCGRDVVPRTDVIEAVAEADAALKQATSDKAELDQRTQGIAGAVTMFIFAVAFLYLAYVAFTNSVYNDQVIATTSIFVALAAVLVFLAFVVLKRLPPKPSNIRDTRVQGPK